MWSRLHTDAQRVGQSDYLQLEHVPTHLVAEAARLVAQDPTLDHYREVAQQSAEAGADDWTGAARAAVTEAAGD